MAERGGKREGAGRPNSGATLRAQIIREKFTKEVEKKLPELLNAKFDLALGHLVQDTNEDGEERIYSKSPDGNALRYLLDQTMGKAKETIDIDNPQQNTQLKEINEKLEGMFYEVKSRRATKKDTNR